MINLFLAVLVSHLLGIMGSIWKIVCIWNVVACLQGGENKKISQTCFYMYTAERCTQSFHVYNQFHIIYEKNTT